MDVSETISQISQFDGSQMNPDQPGAAVPVQQVNNSPIGRAAQPQHQTRRPAGCSAPGTGGVLLAAQGGGGLQADPQGHP